MIRKFETRDTEQVMQIWLAANLDAHDFVPKEYWINQYPFVQEQLLQAEIYVYEQGQTIRGFVGMMGDYLAGVFVEQSCRSSGIGKSLLDCVKKHHAAFSLNGRGRFHYDMEEKIKVSVILDCVIIYVKKTLSPVQKRLKASTIIIIHINIFPYTAKNAGIFQSLHSPFQSIY